MASTLPRVNQVWVPWTDWECLPMYDIPSCNKLELEKSKIEFAKFLGDSITFETAVRRMVEEWPLSCLNFLTNEQINRLAWIGQASACYSVGLQCVFRGGFWLLSASQQAEANGVAFKVLKEWIDDYKRNQEASRAVRESLGRQMLFEWAAG